MGEASSHAARPAVRRECEASPRLSDGALAGEAGFTYDAATDRATLAGGLLTPQVGPTGDADLLGLAANALTVNGTEWLIGLANRFIAKSSDATNNAAHSGIRFVAAVDSRYAEILGYQHGSSHYMGIQFNTYNAGYVTDAMRLSYTGDLAILGALLPTSASSQNLGSTSLEWANLYIGTGRAYFGATQNASVWWDGTDLVLG